jgi:sugar/nucleoside kinase (ribokinase family)
MEPIEAVVAGHLCLDIIPELRGPILFEPGRLVEAGPATLMTGGAVSNTGQSLHKLGVNVHLVGKLGTGLFSRAIQEILERTGEGLSGGLVECVDAPTSYTVVLNLSGHDRMFLHAPGCNAIFESSDVTDEVLASAPLFHFGYPPLMERMYANDGEELEELFRRAKAQGCTTSLDLSLPDVNAESGRANWRAILTRVLPYVDLFLPSIEEAVFMLERQTFDALRGCRLCDLPDSSFRKLALEAHALGAKIVGIKASTRGCYLHTEESLKDIGRARPSRLESWRAQELWAPAFLVDVKGTTGAGDATIAGLLMGLLRGMTAAEAIRAAVAAGASCCEQSDAVSGVQSWADTSHRVADGWQSVNPELDSTWELADGVYRRK